MPLFSSLLLLSLLVAPRLMLTDEPGVHERRGAERSEHQRVAAAAGEYELVDLRIQNDDEARELLSCDVTWSAGIEIEAQFFRPALARDYLPGATLVFDAYAPVDGGMLAPDGVLDLLLVVQVPLSAEPGDVRGTIRVTFDTGRAVECAVSLHVFDFSLPERPTLPALFTLDLAKMVGSDRTLENLDGWVSYYDSLSAMKMAYRMLPGTTATTDSVGSEVWGQHLNYLAATMATPVIDLGGSPGHLVSLFPIPPPDKPQDPLQTYVHELLAGLDGVGSLATPVAEPGPFGPRETWLGLRQSLARVGRADSRVKRLLVGPLHPHFERYTDIWVLPTAVPPGLLQRIATGQSLIRYDQHAIVMGLGSAGALNPSGVYETIASEAVDGSEATAWVPAPSPTGEVPWLEISFQEHYPVETLTILGTDVGRMVPPVVETAFRPGEYAVATLEWERQAGLSEASNDVLVGTFRYPRDCHSLRLSFGADSLVGNLAIAEVLFNNAALSTTEQPIEAIIPWLDGSASGRMAWAGKASGPIDGPRSLPWQCWALGFQGLMGPALLSPTAEEDGLLGLGATSFLPTRRLLAMRDGLEDYEYLHRFWSEVARKELVVPVELAPGMGGEAFDVTLTGYDTRRKLRNLMGRLLSGDGYVTRNFGP